MNRTTARPDLTVRSVVCNDLFQMFVLIGLKLSSRQVRGSALTADARAAKGVSSDPVRHFTMVSADARN